MRSKAGTKESFEQDVVVTSLPPRLDVDDALRFHENMRRAVANGRTRHVIDVDAADLHSASIVALLLEIFRTVRERGGRICLLATKLEVRRKLGRLGLFDVFRVCETVPEATTLLAGRPASALRPPRGAAK